MVFLFVFNSIAGIEKREVAAQKQAEKALAAVNHSVNSDVQNLFDKFNIIYENTKWNNTDIIILGEYAITAPYLEVKVLPGKDGKALDRLTKIVRLYFILDTCFPFPLFHCIR